MTKYVYDHPAQMGVGEHHAEPEVANPDLPWAEPLSTRPAQPPAETDRLRGLAATIGLDADGTAKLDAFVSRTMADLDMPPGTVVTRLSEARDHPEQADRAEEEAATGQVVLGWTDKHGDPRVTAVSEEFFAEHFTQEG